MISWAKLDFIWVRNVNLKRLSEALRGRFSCDHDVSVPNTQPQLNLIKLAVFFSDNNFWRLFFINPHSLFGSRPVYDGPVVLKRDNKFHKQWKHKILYNIIQSNKLCLFKATHWSIQQLQLCTMFDVMCLVLVRLEPATFWSLSHYVWSTNNAGGYDGNLPVS